MQHSESAEGLREFTERIVRSALEKLQLESSGRRVIGTEFELRACVTLARLAPILIAQPRRAGGEPERQEFPPDLDPAEAERLLRELQRGAPDPDDVLNENHNLMPPAINQQTGATCVKPFPMIPEDSRSAQIVSTITADRTSSRQRLRCWRSGSRSS